MIIHRYEFPPRLLPPLRVILPMYRRAWRITEVIQGFPFYTATLPADLPKFWTMLTAVSGCTYFEDHHEWSGLVEYYTVMASKMITALGLPNAAAPMLEEEGGFLHAIYTADGYRDLNNWRVYGDWLMEHDSPRGRVIQDWTASERKVRSVRGVPLQFEGNKWGCTNERVGVHFLAACPEYSAIKKKSKNLSETGILMVALNIDPFILPKERPKGTRYG